MALAFAHTTAGYLAYEVVRPPGLHRPALLLAAVTLANGPDLDFLPGLVLGHAGVYHRGVTHTLGAVVVVGAAVALATGLAGCRRPVVVRAAAWAAAAYASHLLLDYLTADAVPPYGGRFLWPLSDAYYLAPTPVLDQVIIDSSGRAAFVASLLTPQALGVWGRELACLAATVALVHGVRRDAPAGEVPEAS
jgi:membrane-bound metal-dependent hydrolase YbcI (DUF457 family)